MGEYACRTIGCLHCNQNTYTDQNSYAYTNQNPDSYRNENTHKNTNLHSNPNSHPNTYKNANAYADTNGSHMNKMPYVYIWFLLCIVLVACESEIQPTLF